MLILKSLKWKITYISELMQFCNVCPKRPKCILNRLHKMKLSINSGQTFQSKTVHSVLQDGKCM